MGLRHVLVLALGLITSARAAEPQQVTLTEAVARALARSPTAQVAALEVQWAEALVRQARAASLPTLTASATYTRLDDERRFGDRVFLPADQVAGNISAQVPLLAPQRWAAWRHAADQRRATAAAEQEVRRQVAGATARAYLAVLLSHRNLAVAERARDTALVHLQHARARLQGGVGNRLDEVRAAQEAATTEAQVQTARTSLTRAQEALGLLAGADGPLDAADDGAAPIDSHPRVDGRYPLPAAPPLPQALAEAQRRSDVRAQEARAEALERARRNSFTDYLPLLAGVFQPFFLYPAIGVQPPAGWQAQLILTVPLYDGGLRYGQRRERAALSAQARVQLEAVLRQARADVRVAVTAAERADQALRAAQEAARLAGESLKLADLAYRAGATTNLEVIDAERRARDAESAAELAADTARQARLELLIASGRFP